MFRRMCGVAVQHVCNERSGLMIKFITLVERKTLHIYNQVFESDTG